MMNFWCAAPAPKIAISACESRLRNSDVGLFVFLAVDLLAREVKGYAPTEHAASVRSRVTMKEKTAQNSVADRGLRSHSELNKHVSFL